MLSVNHNLSAMNTQRQLGINNRRMSTSLQKLSSGYRINRGADGPADLVISEQLRSQSIGLQRAVRNTQEAQNLLGVAEGAMHEMSAILKEMRQLALHAANNGITSPEQVAADQAELDSGVETLDRIANTTKYADEFLLNGGKALNYVASTRVDNPMDMDMLDQRLSHIHQVSRNKKALQRNSWVIYG